MDNFKPTISFSRVNNKIKAFFSKPANIILVVFLILLTATVLLPLLNFVIDSFIVHSGEVRRIGLPKGSFTFAHWTDLLTDPEYQYSWLCFWKPLVNSVTMALVACAIAVVIGGTIAWLITRSDIPCKKFVSTVFVFPYIMPSWSIAMFWENFFKNSAIAACYNQVGILENLTGIRVPEGMLYGLIPSAICLGIHYAPFAYILIGGILRNMDANLEEAATILKASKFKTLRRITLPIIMPALISTVLLVFASSVSSYTVPAFLNKNNSFTVLSTQMRGLLTTPNFQGQGFAVAIVMLMFSIAIMSLSNWFTGKRKSFTTVTGKSGQVALVKLRKLKYVILSVVLFVVVFFAIVPLISFAMESFLAKPGDLSTFTTYYWTTTDQIERRIAGDSSGILVNPTIWKALGLSIGLSIIVALTAGTLGILTGYAVARNRGKKLAGIVSGLAFFPYLIPAMSFGAIYLSLSYTGAFSFLRGSFLLLALVGSIKFLPFASRSGTNAMMQLSGEIEEAAILVGVPWWKRMTKILFPIQKSSFISGYLLPFVSCMRELSLFVLIAGQGTILTLVLQNFQINGVTQIANGINLLIIVIVLIINLVVNKVTGASIDKGVGG